MFPSSPRIGTFNSRTVLQGFIHDVKEVHKTQRAYITSETLHNVPTRKLIRVIQITSRHSCQPQKVHWEESQIYTYKEQPEMRLCMVFWVLTSSNFGNPEIKCLENSKYCSHTQYVVEVLYYIVGVMKCNVYSSVRQYDSSQTTNGKQNKESKSKHHWCSQPQGTSIQSPQPTENFNSSWNCNNHGLASEILTCIHVQSDSIHVMLPNQEPQNLNLTHLVYHSNITKNRFTLEETQHVTNNTKSWQNQNVDLWMSEEPDSNQ